ncbi:MAG: CHASE domain-containing protein [Magnetococcales bacterium]|nr:CHASE domain-containing protein [Magnetococcales bacterium]
MRREVLEHTRNTFHSGVEQHVSAIKSRMDNYIQVLRSGVALFNTKDSVSREDWRIFVKYLQLEKNFPGIQGVGWSVFIAPPEMENHIRRIRESGFPDYTPRPEGPRDIYTSILFLEPFDWRNQRAFGYDMFSEPVRRLAMSQARDSGEPTLSGKVKLVQETGEKPQAGVLLYLPVYHNGLPLLDVAQRQEAVIGFVYAPFRMDDLLEKILGSQFPFVDLHIYDHSDNAESLLFDSDGILHYETPPIFHHQETLSIAGRQWRLDFKSTPLFEASIDFDKPRFVLIGGLIGSLLLFGLSQNLSFSQQNSERHLRTVQRIARHAIITINERGSILSCNPATEQLFGYSSRQLLGNNVKMLMPEPYHSAHDGYLSRYIATEEAHIIGMDREVVGLKADGSQFPLWLSVGAARSGRGWLFVGSIVDMTEHKQNLKEIRKLSLAVEQSPSVVIIADTEGRIIYTNPRFSEVTGYPAEEVRGKNPRFLKTGHTDAEEYRHLWSLLQKGEIWRGEMQNRRKNGATYWATVAIAPIRQEDGQISGYVSLQEDITLRKEAEQVLISAKEAAERANQAKSDFLNVMSHELRTPLTVILGYLPLLIDLDAKVPLAKKIAASLEDRAQSLDDLRKLFAMIRKMAEEMKRNGSHLLTLINDLLDISKIEAGKLQLQCNLLDADPLLQEVATGLQTLASEKKLLIIREPTTAVVYADRVRLRQILLNLVGNAVKFTEAGSITLSARSAEKIVEFRVADTGCGIPGGELDHVFDRFHQVDSSATRKAGGTGLGLTITRQLVELHGGQISVTSRFGEGTVFSFTIPAVAPDPRSTPNTTPLEK